MSNEHGEIVFGGLTTEEVIDGVRAEAASIRALRYAERFDREEFGSEEGSLALSGLLRTQSEGNLLAHVKLVAARLEESRAPELAEVA